MAELGELDWAGLAAYLRQMNLVSSLCRFVLAAVCGSVIGFERGKKRHAAGLRTHIVVCIGAMSAMLVNQYIITYFNPNSDPARMGAQVISGIGFLGAGTIVITGHQRGQQVKGLTTAAGLWASACMGLAVGVGFYEGAIIMCAFLFLVIVSLNRLDERYLKASSVVRVYLEYSSAVPFSTLLRALRRKGWHMVYVEYLNHENTSGSNEILLDLQRTGRDSDPNDVIEMIRNVEGVLFVEDI